MSRIINNRNKKGKTMNENQHRTQHDYSVEEQHAVIGSAHQPAVPQPKKKKRVFMWFFLAVQALFILWLIAGLSGGGSPAECGTLDAKTCSDAAAVGTGIGVMLVVVLWCIVDFLLAIVWAVTKFARR